MNGGNINVYASTLNGNNIHDNNGDNEFSTIVLNAKVSGVQVQITNSKITASSTQGARQDYIDIRDGSTACNVIINSCDIPNNATFIGKYGEGTTNKLIIDGEIK